MRIQSLSNYMDENEGKYEAAKEEAFEEHITNALKGFMERVDIEDMSADRFAEELEDFEFPEAFDWYSDEYQGEIDDWGDAMYEQERDRRMGL